MVKKGDIYKDTGAMYVTTIYLHIAAEDSDNFVSGPMIALDRKTLALVESKAASTLRARDGELVGNLFLPALPPQVLVGAELVRADESEETRG